MRATPGRPDVVDARRGAAVDAIVSREVARAAGRREAAASAPEALVPVPAVYPGADAPPPPLPTEHAVAPAPAVLPCALASMTPAMAAAP